MILTKVQTAMLYQCLITGAAWVTTDTSPAYELLAGWADKGWMEKVEQPIPLPNLVAYAVTEAGKAPLAELLKGGML